MVLFWIVSPFLNWAHLLGLSPDYAGILQRTMLVVFSFFCLQFILNLIGNILFAHQEPALTNLITPLGNVVSLIIIFILTRTTPSGDLFTVSVVFSSAPVVVLLVFNLLFLGWKYRPIAPGIPLYRIPALQRPLWSRRAILHHPDRLHGNVLQRQYHADPMVRSRYRHRLYRSL